MSQAEIDRAEAEVVAAQQRLRDAKTVDQYEVDPNRFPKPWKLLEPEMTMGNGDEENLRVEDAIGRVVLSSGNCPSETVLRNLVAMING